LVGLPWLFDSGVACWQTCCDVDDQRPCRQLDHWCAALGARIKGLKDVLQRMIVPQLVKLDILARTNETRIFVA
jgi:hypothetical protein